MNIQAATETITVTKYTLTLTEEDVAGILVDATPLQKRLRELRGEIKRGRHGAKDLKLGRPAKEKPAKAAGKGAGRGGFAKEQCPQCQALISKAQMRNHLAKKHGVPAAS